MNDLISRREVAMILDKYRVPDSVYHEINKLPQFSADREKGEWRLGGYDDMYYVCSKCDFKASEYYAKPRFKYCPNCGADMRGGEE